MPPCVPCQIRSRRSADLPHLVNSEWGLLVLNIICIVHYQQMQNISWKYTFELGLFAVFVQCIFVLQSKISHVPHSHFWWSNDISNGFRWFFYIPIFQGCSDGTPIATVSVKNPEGYLQKQPLLTRSISWLLMPWLLTSPGHQQPWNWPYRICRSFSYMRKDLKYLCHINVDEWHKM